jgi:hypothetical protein
MKQNLENLHSPLALMSAFGLSDKFTQFHVSVKSADPKKPSLYTIGPILQVKESLNYKMDC